MARESRILLNAQTIQITILPFRLQRAEADTLQDNIGTKFVSKTTKLLQLFDIEVIRHFALWPSTLKAMKYIWFHSLLLRYE